MKKKTKKYTYIMKASLYCIGIRILNNGKINGTTEQQQSQSTKIAKHIVCIQN